MSVVETEIEQNAVEDLARELHRLVVRELRVRGVYEEERVAAALGLLPIAASALMRRSTWPVEISLRLVDTFDLPVSVVVKTG